MNQLERQPRIRMAKENPLIKIGNLRYAATLLAVLFANGCENPVAKPLPEAADSALNEKYKSELYKELAKGLEAYEKNQISLIHMQKKIDEFKKSENMEEKDFNEIKKIMQEAHDEMASANDAIWKSVQQQIKKIGFDKVDGVPKGKPVLTFPTEKK